MPKVQIDLPAEAAYNARIAGAIIGVPNLSRFIVLAVQEHARKVIGEYKTPSTERIGEFAVVRANSSPFDGAEQGTPDITNDPRSAYLSDVQVVSSDPSAMVRAKALPPNHAISKHTADAAIVKPEIMGEDYQAPGIITASEVPGISEDQMKELAQRSIREDMEAYERREDEQQELWSKHTR